ncbi:MAG: RagB/SusD family nutrient uptake outer membrane protein [Bacteroidota bacterium]
MKRIIQITLLAVVLSGSLGCKKFLNLDPPSDLSGNNFWKTKADVENFTNGMYELMRKSVSRLNMRIAAGSTGNEFAFIPFAGECRGAPVFENKVGFDRYYIADLAGNNIRHFLTEVPTGNNWYRLFNFIRFTQWEQYYKVIAAANIAVDRIGGVPDATLTEADKKAYKGEAVFIRCMTYFFMLRQFGDVPYYTNPYNSSPLKRMPMVDVLKNCVADLEAVKADLPWTYKDPVFVSVRAMRGSAIALLMHMNMWLASFDAGNNTDYYKKVDALGDEIQNENDGAYAMLPLERSGEIFKGRSKEGLFEVPQNANYGESFAWSTFYDLVAYNLPGTGTRVSQLFYDYTYMQFLYPAGQPDKRANIWFDPTTFRTYNNNTQTFRMRKFLVNTDPTALDGFGFDASMIIFRYPDALLLQAEALAEIGNETKAKQMLNKVRDRAEAPQITSNGDELRNDIFFERCRELQGEGHYWYDVVRTRRIIDPGYKYGYHCTVDQYKSGCWTWPINASALVNNPQMTLNTYWQ